MIGERTVDGMKALTLASPGEEEVEAAFVPEAGMVCCSLRHRGEELLGQRGGLSAYVAERGTMGIPLLYPWANRLSERRFTVAGREVALEPPVRLSVDSNGLPIHGLLSAASGWRVERHAATEDGDLLATVFDFGAREELVRAFPFPHQILMEVRLAGATLTVTTAVHAADQVAVPISFGFHPYLQLPGVSRSDWEVEIPVTERLVLDHRMLPTGERGRVSPIEGQLGSRTFDDAYLAPRDSAPLVLFGGGRRIEVSFDAGYPYAQVYAPGDDDVIALEPMTAPTNALVTGGAELPLLAPGEVYRAMFSITVTDAAS
jgi:galactose mutarotase-like enzyme